MAIAIETILAIVRYLNRQPGQLYRLVGLLRTYELRAAARRGVPEVDRRVPEIDRRVRRDGVRVSCNPEVARRRARVSADHADVVLRDGAA